MKNVNLSPALLVFGQIAFMVGVGAPWFFGDILQVFSLLLGPLGIWLVFAHFKNITITKREWLLFGLFWGYYFYFSWREAVSPYSKPTVDFSREELVFFYSPFVVLAFRKINVDKVFEYMTKFLIPGMLIVFLVSWYQHASLDINRVKFATDSPLSLALYLCSGVPISLAMVSSQSRVYRWLALLAWVMGFITIIVFTASRTASVVYLGCAGIFVAYHVLKREYGWKRNLWRLVLLGLLGLIALTLVLSFVVFLDIAPRFTNMLLYFSSEGAVMDNSSNYRLTMWSLMLEHWKDVPTFGIGLEKPLMVIDEYWPFDRNFSHLHNGFLNHYAGGGWIGLILFTAIICFPLTYLTAFKKLDSRFIYVVCIVFFTAFISVFAIRTLSHAIRSSWFVYALMFLQIYFHQIVHREDERLS